MKNWVATCAVGVCVLAAGCSSKAPSTTSTTGGEASSAPSGQEAANAKVALVRFVDAVPDGHASLAFGDTQLFSNVAYKTVTPYKEVPDERHDFKLMTDRTPNDKPVMNSEGLTKGARYTVVAALDKNGAEKLNVINDSLSAPADGKAKVRVINASASEVDVYAPVSTKGTEGTADRAKHTSRTNPYADEDKWFGGVNQDSSTSFKDVAPYDGNMDIVAAGHNTNARMAPSAHIPVNLKVGEIYTVVVAGGTRKHPLEAIKIDDHLNVPNTAATR